MSPVTVLAASIEGNNPSADPVEPQERSASNHINENVASTATLSCRAAPVYWPSEQDLERFEEYVAQHFIEWESHGLVVLSLPPRCFQPYRLSAGALEGALQRTLVLPRIQYFPQFEPIAEPKTSPSKRLRGNKAQAQWPTFPESPGAMTAAAFRDQVLEEQRQLASWMNSRMNTLENTSTSRTNESYLQPHTCFESLSSGECTSFIEKCFWQALEHGFDGHRGQTLYAIDIAGLCGGSMAAEAPSWLPAGIHTSTIGMSAENRTDHTGNRTAIGLRRPLSLLSLWPRAGGINEPMTYLGSTLSRFGFHVEDMHLCSMSMLWLGEPKIWYAVPAAFADDLERLLTAYWVAMQPDAGEALSSPVTQPCSTSALTSKSLLISPDVLKQNRIPVYRAVQRPGHLVLTMPRTYHCGFNCGWNMAEAINWAPIGWLSYCRSAMTWERRLLKTGTVNDLMLAFAQILLILDAETAPQWLWTDLHLFRRTLQTCVRWTRMLDAQARLHRYNQSSTGEDARNQQIRWIRCSTACLEAAKELEQWRLESTRERTWWKRSRQRAWDIVIRTLTSAKVLSLRSASRTSAHKSSTANVQWWRDAVCVSTLFCSICRAACGTVFSICLECLQYRGTIIMGICCEEHLRLNCHHQYSLKDADEDVQTTLPNNRTQVDQQKLTNEQYPLPLLIVSHLPPTSVLRHMLHRWDDFIALAKQTRFLEVEGIAIPAFVTD
jgi:hypothetical protein